MIPRMRPLVLCALLALCAAPVVAEDDPATPHFLLLETQLLETPGGYPAFCAEHATAARLKLRGEVVTKLKQIADAEQPKVILALGKPGETATRLWLVNALIVSLTSEQLEAAKQLPQVKHVYPAGMMPGPKQLAKTGTVSTAHKRPKKERKWKLGTKTVPWNLEKLNVPKVWKELEITGLGVTVAMFDSGINYEHEDLIPNLWINPGEKANNGKDDDKNGFVDDVYGWHFPAWSCDVMDRSPPKHGSLTSSVVAGTGKGGQQTGVAPRASLMAILGFGGPANACRAFQYAIEQGADISSMSFSIPNLGDTRGLWRMMAENASAAGLVLISGAGNFGRQQDPPVEIRIPEGIPCVICVGGVKLDLTVPLFVSLGPVEWASVKFYGDHPMPKGLIKPDVVAFPGPGIGLIRGGQKDGYLPPTNGRRGNSLSAPHAAGVVALMLEADPTLTPWRVKEILEETAQDLETKGKDVRTGAGLIDAFKAVQRAKAGAPVTTGEGK